MKKFKYLLLILIIGGCLICPSVKADPMVQDGACPIGYQSDTYKDLIGILDIMKIAGPLLVVGFTIFELIKATASGDSQAEFKRISSRLVKRLVYCVILFAIPILVEVGLKLMGIDGGCSFTEIPEATYIVK